MAAIIVLSNYHHMEDLAKTLPDLLKQEAKKLRETPRSKLFPEKAVAKTPFVAYFAAYWLSAAVHDQLDNCKVIEKIYTIYEKLATFADNGEFLQQYT